MTMPATLLQIQQLLILVLPPLMSLVGLYAASLLRQDHFPVLWNAAIAWAVLLVIACASAWAHNQLVGSAGLNGILTVVWGVATLLVAGPLSKLRDFLQLDWIQSHLFDLSEPQVQALLSLAGAAVTQQPVTAQHSSQNASAAQKSTTATGTSSAAKPFNDASPKASAQTAQPPTQQS